MRNKSGSSGISSLHFPSSPVFSFVLRDNRGGWRGGCVCNRFACGGWDKGFRQQQQQQQSEGSIPPHTRARVPAHTHTHTSASSSVHLRYKTRALFVSEASAGSGARLGFRMRAGILVICFWWGVEGRGSTPLLSLPLRLFLFLFICFESHNAPPSSALSRWGGSARGDVRCGEERRGWFSPLKHITHNK